MCKQTGNKDDTICDIKLGNNPGTRLKKLVVYASENNDVKRVIADGAYYNKEEYFKRKAI